MGIGNYIKYYRKMNNLSQKDLAAKLGISDKTISSWEIDRTEPNMGAVEMMCAIFGCSKTDLIDGPQNDIPKYVPGTVELIDLYSKATPEQRQAVLNLLRSFVGANQT